MKRISNYIAWLAVMLLVAAAEAQSATWEWEIDKSHTNVGFWVKHLGVSKVQGRFTEYEAKVKADPATGKLEAVEALVQASSVNTALEPRDNHLKAADFFDAAKFPTLKLKTKSLTWNGDSFSGVAALTMKGVTKDVPFEGELVGAQLINFGAGAKMRAGYSVKAKLNRQDFGLTFNGLAEGVKMVDDIVHIELEVEVVHAPKATK